MATLMTVVGARPQFIKAAAVSRALAQRGVRELLVHTGQHFDAAMSDVFFAELGLAAPHRNLGIHGGTNGAMVARMLAALEAAIAQDRPDAVLVYGDTNSTLAAALAAAGANRPLIHIEAGLRSFNRAMPEETNRIVADRLATVLLAPTKAAVANLAREGMEGEHVGDVMYDAALFAMVSDVGKGALESLGLGDAPFALATVHRAENVDNPARLARLMAYIGEAAGERLVVLPAHPRLAKALTAPPRNVRLVPPQGYFAMQRLIGAAELVLTDSGGVQKEAYFHRTPCITLRDETEWVETVEAGWNRLWTDAAWREPRRDIADYGDGRAAERCADAIAALLGGSP
jgi:UDP-GlcNAc3NAcA epimerase